MKQLLALLITSTFILLSSCSSSKKEGEFRLLPSPQTFEIAGVSDLSFKNVSFYTLPDGVELAVLGEILKNIELTEGESEAQISCKIDESLNIKPEGYQLVISEDHISIIGKDELGLFYGFMTLRQLLEDAEEQKVNLPICTIEDYPRLAYRAIHLDIKHHMEKLEYYYSLMDKLASYKINAIIAEVEDKIKYERQPVVGSPDALSIEQWKKLSDYAMARNIEISPLVQGLGHASFILKHDQYKTLRDNPESDWAFNPLDPETYTVQFDLYMDAMEATPHGRYLHVGGDEVHTTGKGSGKSNLELQLIWLNKVCDFAEEHSRIPIFWDDMPLKHAGVYHSLHNKKMTEEAVEDLWSENEHKLLEFLDEFPKNCIYMRWNYGAPQAIGNSRAMEWFRKNDLQVMGATAGQCRWVLMPQDGGNLENIKYFALSSIESGLDGLLLTLWDDDSPHFELYQRGILTFAEYTWSGDKRTLDEVRSAYRHREFSYQLATPDFVFIDQLEKPVIFWKNALLKGNQRNYLVKSENPLELVIDMPDENNPGKWRSEYAVLLEQAKNHLETCDSISNKIKQMKELAKRNHYTIEVYEQVNKLVRFSAEALLLLEEYDQFGNRDPGVGNRESGTGNLTSEIAKLHEKFRTLRSEFEAVYSKTRILTKPDDYLLDQDHHVHLANQTRSFDWQFYAEMIFLENLTSVQ